jgi:excinuclease ABC subunit C
MLDLKGKLKKLPANPGVYTFLDKKKSILYIGKATNLKSRVGSYFQGRDDRGVRIVSMVSQIANIKVQKTDSVLEALILESNLIKKFQPKYNIERKDDKSFTYAAITKEKFPRILIMRETDLSAVPLKRKNPSPTLPLEKGEGYAAIFGPYTSKKQLTIALKIMRKIFPYHSLKQETEKGCLDFQIGLCPGPWEGNISRENYLKNIRGIKMILQGRKKSLLRKLEKEMQEYSKKHEFEQAAEARNKIFALKHIRDVAITSFGDENFKTPSANWRTKFRIEAYDISNISGQHAVGSMVVFENNEPNKNEYRKFKIKTVEGSNDVGMLAEVLFRRFRNDWLKPDLILLDGGKGHLNMAEKVLEEFKLEIPMVAVAKGPNRKNVKIQMTNKKSILNDKLKTKNSIKAPEINLEIKNLLKNRNFVKKIMDEAHRFAVTYHKKLRKNDFLKN